MIAGKRTMAFAVLTLLISTPIISAAQDVQAINKDAGSFEIYVGRLIRAINRDSLSSDKKGIAVIDSQGETTEDVLTELINKQDVWSRFNLQQKKELTFVSLIYGHLQGGSLTTLLILLERDARPIAIELGMVTDKTLTEEFHLNKEGSECYRRSIGYLKGK